MSQDSQVASLRRNLSRPKCITAINRVDCKFLFIINITWVAFPKPEKTQLKNIILMNSKTRLGLPGLNLHIPHRPRWKLYDKRTGFCLLSVGATPDRTFFQLNRNKYGYTLKIKMNLKSCFWTQMSGTVCTNDFWETKPISKPFVNFI